MKKQARTGATSEIKQLLCDAPQPLFSGEIWAELNEKYQREEYSSSEVSSALSKLVKRGIVAFERKRRAGPGVAVAKVYFLVTAHQDAGI